MRRAVFLDRDGVLDLPVIREGKPYPPASVAELEITPGASEALASLREAGFCLVMVTNQPDVARGSQDREVVEAINGRVKQELDLDAVYVCYHDDVDACACRKPKSGLMTEAARVLDLDLSSSFMVGDRWRDIEAGHGAGCKTAFIDYGYDEALTVDPDKIVGSLIDAVSWILAACCHENADRSARVLGAVGPHRTADAQKTATEKSEDDD